MIEKVLDKVFDKASKFFSCFTLLIITASCHFIIVNKGMDAIPFWDFISSQSILPYYRFANFIISILLFIYLFIRTIAYIREGKIGTIHYSEPICFLFTSSYICRLAISYNGGNHHMDSINVTILLGQLSIIAFSFLGSFLYYKSKDEYQNKKRYWEIGISIILLIISSYLTLTTIPHIFDLV